MTIRSAVAIGLVVAAVLTLAVVLIGHGLDVDRIAPIVQILGRGGP